MIIAERVLKLRSDGRDIQIPIRLFAPEQSSDGSWWCRYEIDWPESTQKSRAGGVDAIQANVLALHMIGSEIYASDYHKSGNLFLDSPGKGYGFPVPCTLRNLLEGDDQKFF